MSYDFSEVEKNIRENNINLAQDLLDKFRSGRIFLSILPFS